MENQELELFVHAQGAKPQVITAPPSETVRELLVRAGIQDQGDGGLLVFIGENEEALREPDGVDDGADEQEPVDMSMTLEHLQLHRHRHVHVHRCRHVAVDVHFAAHTKHRRFAPSATVGLVTRWARKKLRLDPAAAAEYVLQLCKSTDRPRADKTLGELVTTTCGLCFDLVKEITPQG